MTPRLRELSDSTEILVVHISDLHARCEKRDQMAIRTKALLADLESISAQIDLVVFSGDAAYAGKPEEFQLARDELFDKIVSRLHINRRRIITVPGNHDVDRTTINEVEEAGLRSLINGTDDAERFIEAAPEKVDRLENYYAFLKEFKNEDKTTFSASTFLIKGVNVGIAALNSAWRCADDQDKERLFLTERVVNKAASELENADLRIAVLHHPFDWYHSSERSVVLEDLKRRFNIILTGHLHDNTSLAEVTPNHETLHLATRALFDGKISEEGYNYYGIDFANKKLHAHYRKFFRRRDRFDKDTEHAHDGCHAFNLPVASLATHSQIVLAQRISEFSSGMLARVRQQLQRFQPSEEPVFVTPKIVELSRQAGVSSPTQISSNMVRVSQQNSIIVGPSEGGKTVLLQSMCAELNAEATQNAKNRVGIYVDLRNYHSARAKELEAVLHNTIRNVGEDLSSKTLVLVCDHIDERDLSQLDDIRKLADENQWIVIAAIESQLLMDAVANSTSFDLYSLFQLQTWGPSRIREFIKKLFAGGSINVDAAYGFLTASLRDTDIPATPVVVAMYLSVFPTLGYQITSLSFLRLLERIEQFRLESHEKSSTYSLYNKREVLMRLSKLCFEHGRLYVPRETVERMIKEFFEKSLLPVQIPKFLDILDETRLISVTQREVGFSYYAFYDYYLAKAFEKGIVDIASATTKLDKCIALGHALELHGGLIRENESILSKLLAHIEADSQAPTKSSLAALDRYIHQALEPVGPEPVEEIAKRHIDKQVDYEQYDTEYEESKKHNVAARAQRMQLTKPKGQIEELEFRIDALKTFYNLFRNLENIEGESKIRFLERILDFHIDVNFALIDLFSRADDTSFHTFTGYFVTLAGQVFLSANVGNESLGQTIKATLERTESDLKQLLLLNLYSDLRLRDYPAMIEKFLIATKSPAGIEIIYHRLTHILIHHEGDKPPEDIVRVFKLAFEKRQDLYGKRQDRGAFTKAYEQTLAARRLIWAT
jgi:predicted phosphodiesterase